MLKKTEVLIIRYSQLAIELNEVQDNTQADSLLNKYIPEETFAFYRNLAIEELNALEADEIM